MDLATHCLASAEYITFNSHDQKRQCLHDTDIEVIPFLASCIQILDSEMNNCYTKVNAMQLSTKGSQSDLHDPSLPLAKHIETLDSY